MNQNKITTIKLVIISVIVLLLIGLLAYGLFKSYNKSSQYIISLQGQMDMQHTAISSKVAGRISKILVSEGGEVSIGQQLIEMEVPEITAKINQAKAAQFTAQSQLKKAENGARFQEVAQAYTSWQANQQAADFAKVTSERLQRLYEEGLISRQKSEEAYVQYIAQQGKAEVARQQFEMAKEGARQEDKEAAAGQVAQVNAKLQEALIAQDEANLRSPVSGIVDNIIVNTGEVVGQGVPLINIANPEDQWVVLNVTENNLSYFPIGKKFEGSIPALSKPNAPYRKTFTVFSSAVLSDFATWRPTNNNDGFDVRTFQIKARPTQPDPNIRAGMSVIITLNQKK